MKVPLYFNSSLIVKAEIFTTCPELNDLSKLEYTLGLSAVSTKVDYYPYTLQTEKLEIEFIKFMNAHSKIEGAIARDEVIPLQLYIKGKEKRSESISINSNMHTQRKLYAFWHDSYSHV
jgi:hypothetical protein